MKLATWNINSIRARTDRLIGWLAAEQPDVLCLQETKVEDAAFPLEALRKAGYETAIFGQKSYNGVAIASREPLENVVRGLGDDAVDEQARLIAATTFGMRIVCVYVPNGGELTSDKFPYKLAWYRRLRAFVEREAQRDVIVAGLSVVFSVLFIWYSRNTGHDFWVYWAPFFMAGGALLLGIPVYRSMHGKMTEPDPVPPYR